MGLGSDLRQAREARKISLETVSQKTRIPVKYLEALESEQYGIFPSQTHARGFARAYAKVVGLDPAALTARFKSEVEPVEVKIKPPNAEHEIPSGFSLGFLKRNNAPARRERLSDEDFEPEAAPVEEPSVRRREAEPVPAAPTLRRPFRMSPGATAALWAVLLAAVFVWAEPRLASFWKGRPGPVAASAPATTPVPSSTPVPAAPRASTVAAAPVVAPLPGVKDKYQHLVLKGLQQSWILVTMDDGQSSSEIDLAPGETKSYKALRNFKLRIGNAGGVDASYDGKPLGVLGVSGQVVELSLPGKTPAGSGS